MLSKSCPLNKMFINAFVEQILVHCNGRGLEGHVKKEHEVLAAFGLVIDYESSADTTRQDQDELSLHPAT